MLISITGQLNANKSLNFAAHLAGAEHVNIFGEMICQQFEEWSTYLVSLVVCT